MTPPPELLTAAQAAKYLGVKVGTMSVWRYRKGGPAFVKIGGAVRYRPEDLDAYIESRVVRPRH